MNSKFAKMALPGLVMGLALGLSVPAVSFAQDDHHDHADRGSGQTRSSGGGDHGNRGGGGQTPQYRGNGGGNNGGDRGGNNGGGDRGAFVGARTQDGAAARPQPQGGGQPGYRGPDRSNDNRGPDRANDYRGGDNRGGDRGNYRGGGDDHYRGNDRDRGGDRHDDRGRGGDRGHFDWHGDSRFNGYSGVRLGFYFAPGRGYYHVPDQYYGHHWGRGEYLPRYFFSYRVYDPDYYDLPYPPYGCAWMFVGEDAVLVDLDTGEIIDIVYGVF